jgi:alanine racemase
MLSWIEIDTEALRRNIDAFRGIVPAGTALMVVVKANAYGHGLEVVAPVAAERAEWLGVNAVDEAVAIRALGIERPVAILGYTEPADLDTVVAHGLRQVVYRTDIAAALAQAARKHGTTAHVHLKIETGTNRQGIAVDELAAFVERVREMDGIAIEGAYTHFANIEDTLDPSYAELQIARFREALAVLGAAGVQLTHVHAAATSAALLYPETGFAMMRLGIGTYGVWPSRETQLAAREKGRRLTLSPVLTWKTRIAQVKRIRPGEFVGYGLTYQARRPMKAAVLPIGYYDGYDRKLSNTGRALVRGHPVPVIGRIAMNMTMLDVTDVHAQADDEVVLLGRQGAAEIRVEELAEKSGTIGYEVLARINPRLPRIPVQVPA